MLPGVEPGGDKSRSALRVGGLSRTAHWRTSGAGGPGQVQVCPHPLFKGVTG
jgi:hypothetical protein